ncbi:TcaA NTF2-like domain-containing protein [Metaplanococcus flavidus]|uniref:Zinc-ribbon domain-containing protein n=1 Tax=Metaplanococcus flavidus TaxID=569883 RepID=A0ABW3LBA7_9BACL
MKKFCTNCGHANDQDNRICVECGASLTEEKQSSEKPAQTEPSVKTKKPLSLKTKILAAVALLFAASLIGVYSWGSETASADTVVTKFLEALENEDAGALVKQVQLSNGEAMTVKEAGAFIELYGNITPYELEDVASIEKNGKVIGIFDAHRVVIPTQKLSFSFPHDGLALSLNGELVTSADNSDGDYVFSGISPGLHEAEFLYEGELAEFQYPFQLEAYMYADSSVIDPIYVDLPVSSVMFGLELFNAEDPGANKVIIGKKEVSVNEYGETDDIGPLLLDGSTTARAEVIFPWGPQLSDPVDITSDYHMLEFSGLGEEQHAALIDQLKLFAEEYVQAFGTRDSNVFTTVTKDQLTEFKEGYESMEYYENLFMGSLTEIIVDEEAITILSDGKTVTANVELQIDGDYYYASETPEPEEMEVTASIDFVFDKESGKWLVSYYNEGAYVQDFTPTDTYEGSGKVFEKAMTSVEVEETDEEDRFAVDERSVEWLMSDYNDASVAAINAGDFSLVSGLIYGSGPRAEEQSDFIDYMYSEGITEEHLSTQMEKLEKLDDDYYEVTTIEKFIIHNEDGSNEKTYRTVTKLRVDTDGTYIYELISTTEI